MNKRLSQGFSIVLLPLLVWGCAGKIEKADPNPTPQDMKKGPGLFSGKSGNILDAFKSGSSSDDTTGGAAIGVNAYLWRASLEAISFMPVVQSDSAGGVILTDWYQNPENSKERTKVNILILGRALKPQALKVSVFKQEMRGNQWADVDSPVTTARELEDIILTNARTLRIREKVAD